MPLIEQISSKNYLKRRFRRFCLDVAPGRYQEVIGIDSEIDERQVKEVIRGFLFGAGLARRLLKVDC